jgi:hypothetical protein
MPGRRFLFPLRLTTLALFFVATPAASGAAPPTPGAARPAPAAPPKASADGTRPSSPTAAKGAPAAPAAITLSRSVVPATGRQTADVTVTRFGRYALTTTSAQGTAAQLVDHMTGPGEIDGAPGGANGRVEAFLERGTYRLVALSDRAGSGDARLEAHPFVEKNGAAPPLLPEQSNVTTTLGDLEQRSWWVEVPDDGPFAIEIAGRSLGDVRLWREGQWLDPAAATCETIAADPARPLRGCTVAAHLSAGLYQLVVYGAPALPWSVPDAAQPLHIRYGVPTLPAAGRLTGEVGPFGTERWRIPGAATAFRLELPAGPDATRADATLTVRPIDESDPFRRDGSSGRVQKQSLPPVAEVGLSPGSEDRVVTVTGAVGQAFVLQHFPKAGRSIAVRGSGTYFLTTLHAGDPADRPDVTGVLVEARSSMLQAGATPIASSLVPLGPENPYRRRFNALGPTTISFDVLTDADYQVAVPTAGVRWRVEPLLTTHPPQYVPPPSREGTGTVSLVKGRWTMTLEPTTPGIVEMAIRSDPMAKLTPNAPHANVQFPSVRLEAGKAYTLTLNQEPDSDVGMVLRALPVDLAEPLPVTLGAGESVSVPATVGGRGTLDAGGTLEVAVDGGAWAARVDVGEGAHTVAVRNPAAAPVQASVAFLAAERRPDATLPPLPDTLSPSVPDLPVLSAASPRLLDLARDATATYRLVVDHAGLYRVESTGLLATAGALRTRTNPSLVSGAQNGVGRNFLLQTYLREGDYQATVGAQGPSAGHLGLRLASTTLRDGGLLRDGAPARATVPAGEGIAYRFDVAEAGDYALRTLGQGHTFRVRVEDADGWPLVAPEVDGNLTLALDPGSYRVVLLPEAVQTTRITTLDRVVKPLVRLGHGPHALPLDTPVTHVWWEPAPGAPREPDLWQFQTLAPADFTLSVNAEMTGELYLAGQTEPIARLVPGRAWEGRLDTGSYRVELVNTRRNAGVQYTLSVQARELVPGASRAVEAPAEVPVSVGAEALVELASMGGDDVRARLFDAGGTLVASSDDRPDDWNFRVQERLAAGSYILRIDPVGTARAACSVTMSLATEAEAPPLAAGQTRELPAATPGSAPGSGPGTVQLVPLQVPGEGLLVVSARSTENLGVAIEAQEGHGWRTLDRQVGATPRVAVRLGVADRRYRLRVESLDGRGVPAHLRVDVVKPREVAESAVGAGALVPAAEGPAPGLAAAVVTRKHAGVLQIATQGGMSWCPLPGEACAEVPGALLAAPGDDVWLFAESAGRAVNLHASRFALATTGRVTLPGGHAVTADVAPAAGPVLVIARSEAGQPGVRLGETGPAAKTGGVATGGVATRTGAAAYTHGAAVAVDLVAESPVASVFDGAATFPGAPGAIRTGSMAVDLTRVAFPVPTEGTWAGGAAGSDLAGGGAWVAKLPGTPARVRLALGAGLVGVLSRGETVTATVWASDGPVDETIDTDADHLTLLNPAGQAVPWSATLGGAPAARAAAVANAAPIERIERIAGHVRVGVVAQRGAQLHVRGAVAEVAYVGGDGRVAWGTDFPLGDEVGTLEITHGVGPWIAWVDTGGASDGAPLWAGEPPKPPKEATPLPGEVRFEASKSVVRVDAPGEGVLQLRASAPLVVLVSRDGHAYRDALALDGALDIPVAAAGPVTLAVRPVGAGAPGGVAELRFVPSVGLDEGMGAETLLAPGDTRAFGFTVPVTGPLGVGVRAEGVGVTASLRDAEGNGLGDGLVQMPTLPAGRYQLLVHLPADGAPARIRPALVGVRPPDTGPPADVIRGYLVAAGLLPPDAPSAPDASDTDDGEETE